MKLDRLNLGTPLSRDGQKRIKGGQGICQVGWGVTDCVCYSGAKPCVPGNGTTPFQACNAFCAPFGGARSGSKCVFGACQP